MTDALELLAGQHREVQELFLRIEGLQAMALGGHESMIDERTRVTATIVEKLSKHAVIEELHFYPEIQDKLAVEARAEHQEVKELLARIDEMSPDHVEFDEALRAVIADVRHHVEFEETQIFPSIREAVGPTRLIAIGRKLEGAMKLAPTHPHPYAPVKPGLAQATGLLDKVRDVMERRHTEG